MKEQTGVHDESKGSTRYAWIGAGGCGGRLVKSFYDLGYRKALAVNTSHHDLDLLDIPKSQKFLIEIGREEGTSRDMEKATKAIQQHRHDILHLTRQTFGTQVDRIMVCFGAGGGTGGGSVIELIEIAKRYSRYIGLENPNRKVGVVMTLPTIGEASLPLVAENAHKIATKLSQMATSGEISPLIIIDNDKIKKMHPGMTAKSFWPGINNTVASLFDIFNRLSSMSSPYTCFDSADYGSIMGAGGCLIMGASEVDRLDDTLAISKSVENSLQTTLFAGGEDLSTAKAGGCIVIGGNELMTYIKGMQDNIDYAFDTLSEVSGQATICRGIYEDERDGLGAYTIIGGLKSPTARLEELSTDLYHQPDMVEIEGLPIKERREDILAMAEYFLTKQANSCGGPHKNLSSEARTIVLNYSWPGNLRELANAIEYAYDGTVGQHIPPEALPYDIIFADTELYSEHALPTIDRVKLRITRKAYDEFLQSLP
jgi:cell division GTPase FtsZ